MDPDDAADVVENLTEPEISQILVRMDPAEAEEIRRLSDFKPDSAGGIMTPEFVAVTADATADSAIAAIRGLVGSAETVDYVYVVDAERHLIGVLSLYRLMLSPGMTPVTELIAPTTVRVRASADRETAANLLTERNLLAIPVVDDEDHLLGIITQDDVADVLEAEATEDIERLGGSQPLNVPYRLSSVALLVRKRIGWLLLLFIAEAYTGSVLRAFSLELEQAVALSFFIPLLIGTGGNVGSQTVTLIVRAMALNEVSLRDVGWIVWKELRVGLIMGAIMAVVALGRAQLLGVGTNIGLVVAVTILAISVWSATVAAVLPLTLRRLRIDPAVVSAFPRSWQRAASIQLVRDSSSACFHPSRPAIASQACSVWIQTSPSGCHSGSCGVPKSARISGKCSIHSVSTRNFNPRDGTLLLAAHLNHSSRTRSTASS